MNVIHLEDGGIRYEIPTVYNGQEVAPRVAASLFRKGLLKATKAVKTFQPAQEAPPAAVVGRIPVNVNIPRKTLK